MGARRKNIFQQMRELGFREGTGPPRSRSKSVAALGTEPEPLDSQATAPSAIP